MINVDKPFIHELQRSSKIFKDLQIFGWFMLVAGYIYIYMLFHCYFISMSNGFVRIPEEMFTIFPHAWVVQCHWSSVPFQVMKHMKISASLDKGTPNMEKWPLGGIMGHNPMTTGDRFSL